MANEEHLAILKQGVEVWNRWREQNTEIKPDLHSAVLLNASLMDADLRRADLRNANLFGADLRNAYLNLADLNRADLSNASLIDTDLTAAILIGVNLGGAELTGANLSQVRIGYTTFGANDLRTAIGLDLILFMGPSTVGIDTIYKSGGNIPEVFLRGCGVPEEFITYARSLTSKAIDFYSCFISYSHEDKPFARRLHDQLQARGIRCWLDEHQVLPGHDIYDEVDRGIRLWDKVLLCCSKDSLSSWWVDKEIATAFDKEQALWKERGKKALALIPLNLDGHMFSGQWQDGKAIPIKTRLAADFTGWESDNAKFEREFERLVKALRADGGDREAPPTPKL